MIQLSWGEPHSSLAGQEMTFLSSNSSSLAHNSAETQRSCPIHGLKHVCARPFGIITGTFGYLFWGNTKCIYLFIISFLSFVRLRMRCKTSYICWANAASPSELHLQSHALVSLCFLLCFWCVSGWCVVGGRVCLETEAGWSTGVTLATSMSLVSSAPELAKPGVSLLQ